MKQRLYKVELMAALDEDVMVGIWLRSKEEFFVKGLV